MLVPDPPKVGKDVDTPQRPSAAAGVVGGVLSAPQGTVVNVQTACYVVQASSETLRQNKSLAIAARDLDEFARGRGGAGSTELAYCPDRHTEALHAVTCGAPGGPPRPRSAAGVEINPELYFQFQCLLRERDFGDEELQPHPDVAHDFGGAAPVSRRDNGFGDWSDMDSSGPAAAVVDPNLKEECIIAAMANNAMLGINSSLISVGGSGTGKADRLLHPDDGLLPRTVNRLFELIEAASRKDKDAFRRANRTVSVSIVECFSEEFADLLTIPVQEAPKDDTTEAHALGAPSKPFEDQRSAFTATATGPPNPPLPTIQAELVDSSPGTTPAVSPAHQPSDSALKRLHTDPLNLSKRSVSFSADLITFAAGPSPFAAAAAAVVQSSVFEKERFDPVSLRHYVAGQSVTPSSTGLRLRQHPELGPVVEGAQELQILSVKDFMHVARGAIARRVSSGVKTNRYSHLIAKITLRQVEVGAAAALTSVLTFVDTATAMRVPSTIPKAKKVQQSTNGFKKMLQALSEHCLTPSALFKTAPESLGRSSRPDDPSVPLLSDLLAEQHLVTPGQARTPTPAALPNMSQSAVNLLFKESSLTQLLADAFTGNSYTILLGSVLDPASLGDVGTTAMEEEGAQQTLVTLKLVARASSIATRVSPNYAPVQAAAHAIRDEIEQLKNQLARDYASSTEEQQAAMNAKLQSYEDKLGNIQSAFEAKESSRAELEAQCRKQRSALEQVQQQLASRQKQAEELDTFAAEIDTLLEEHRRNEVRLRREQEALRERELEAQRLQRELSIMAREQSDLEAEMATMQAEHGAQRQRNVAAFFKSLLEQEKQKRDIAAMEQANRQLRARCAVWAAKCEKFDREKAAVASEIDQSRAVHAALVAKMKTLEEDRSADMADEQVAQIVELTHKLQAKLAYIREDLKTANGELAAAQKAFEDDRAAHILEVRAANEALTTDANARSRLARKEEDLKAQQTALEERQARATKHTTQLRSLVEQFDRELQAKDEERRRHTEQSTLSKKDRDLSQDELLTLSAALEGLRVDIDAWASTKKHAAATYSDLCNSASGRFAALNGSSI
jgi:hypothetical protein